MTFAHLCLVVAVGLFGPLLALPKRWHVPVVVGELAAGVVLGPTGTKTLNAASPTFTFLADIGFALVMFVAGTHVPVRDPALRPALKHGLLRAVGVGAIAVALGAALSHAFDTGHTALYAVLMTSSSAALILPIVDSVGLSGPTIVQLLPQVAVADAACIVLLPLAIEPSRAGRSALGALAVLACSAAFWVFLREAERRGWREALHEESKQRSFAMELRISLLVLFGLAAIAVRTHVSIMLAGFGLGIAVTAVGEPRRLARQMFGITEGFFGPLFFVWLGASLNLRALGDHPKFIGLGLLLGLGAVATHAAMTVTKQPPAAGALAAAQLGVPVAATTLGQQLHLLAPGEPAALILGALVTIAVATLAGGLLARGGAAQSPPRNSMSAGATTGEPRSS
ncbi:MAG TPA: cation:proton antiporter [Sporichthyaceae bacterium]|jgi:Kef-type K+ transport system membrane component KefB